MLARKLLRSTLARISSDVSARCLSSMSNRKQSCNENCFLRKNVRIQQKLSWSSKVTVRTYATHSQCNKDSEHGPEEENEEEMQAEILKNALRHVPAHGWSREALRMSAEDMGYSSVAEGMFKRGGADLVLYFVKTSNNELVNYMGDTLTKEEEKIKSSQFIRNVLEHRLRMLIPYISSWQEAMAILLQPTIIAESTQELGRMVDDIWFYAGDTSTDFNWYSKRGILAKLFISMQMVMIKDQSPDFTDSWEFLDRRMRDIATFGRVSLSMQKQGKAAADIAFAGFTVISNITGFGERRR